MRPTDQREDQFDAVLHVPGGDRGERVRRLRRAAKLLLRACGVRLVTLVPAAGHGVQKAMAAPWTAQGDGE